MLNSVIQHLYILPGCSLAGSVYRSIKKLIYQRVVNVSTNPLPLVAARWDQAWGGGGGVTTYGEFRRYQILKLIRFLELHKLMLIMVNSVEKITAT